MASSGNHNGSCAHATGHRCACSGCGGSLHGWQGWIELAADDTTREAREKAFGKEVRRREAKKPTERTRLNRMSLKALVTDLTRLDLAGWLSNQRRRQSAGSSLTLSDSMTVVDDGLEALPDDYRPATTTPQPPEDRVLTKSSAGSPSGSSTATYDGREVPPDDGSTATPQPPGDGVPIEGSAGSRPDVAEQVQVLAQWMAEATWEDIAAEIAANSRDAATVRRQLANHFWCDLFVAFARALDDLQQGVQEIPEGAKELIKRSVHGSSMQPARSAVSDRIIDFAVERAWTALRTATIGANPLLAVLSGDELLRGLRILAVFICPAPENHTEVRIYAMKPLADDAREYLTEETKARLAGSFAELG